MWGLDFLREMFVGEPLCEMSNLILRYTGIPGNVYVCTKEEMKNPQAHALGRVKLLHGGDEVSVSIKADRDGRRKVKGRNSKMISNLTDFVRENELVLWEFWNTPKDEADVGDLISKIKKL